jgi:hypothetical protein
LRSHGAKRQVVRRFVRYRQLAHVSPFHLPIASHRFESTVGPPCSSTRHNPPERDRLQPLHQEAQRLIRVIDGRDNRIDPATDAIIEIASIDMVRRGITNAMGTLVRPGKPTRPAPRPSAPSMRI